MTKIQKASFLTRYEALLLLVATVVSAVMMQWLQAYRFYAKEAEHLLLNDPLWVCQWSVYPGGLSQLITSSFTQFFGIWGVGELTMALLFGLLMFFGMALARRLQLSSSVSSWWLLPVFFLFLCHENGYYSLRGTLSTVIAVGAAWVYVSRPSRLMAALLAGIVWWLTGAAVLLFAVVVVVAELVSARRWWNMFIAVVTALLCAVYGVSRGVWTDMNEALTPAQYYEWPSTYFFPLYAWLGVVGVLLLGKVSRFGKALQVAGVIVPSVMLLVFYQAVHSPKVYLLRQDEWRASRQDWDGIIAAHEGLDAPTPFMSYLNLALAQRGQLVQRMGEFHPLIVWSDEAQMYSPVLMTQNELSRDALKLQSSLCMAWGGAALCNAQKAAYEANFLTPGDTDPVELRRLVLTNALFETPKTAQKYLRRLSLTTMHHAWADSMLQDPRLLEAEVEALRCTLPQEDSFYLKTQVGRMLRQVAMQDPTNLVATQFYEAYLIQSRDSVAFRHWHEFLASQRNE